MSASSANPRRRDLANLPGPARAAGQRLYDVLSPRPWVAAVFHNGSTVAKTDQPESDVDFTVVVQGRGAEARTLRLLKTQFRYHYLGLDHGVPSFRARRNLGIVIVDRPTIEDWLARLYRSPEDFLDLQGVVQHKIVEAVPIFDPDHLLDRYQARARAYPRRMQKAIFSRAMNSLGTIYGNWGFRNEFHYVTELPALVENISQALYARNRRLLMFPFKRLHVDLAGLKPNLEGELYRVVRGGRSARNRAESRNVLKRVIRRLRAAN